MISRQGGIGQVFASASACSLDGVLGFSTSQRGHLILLTKPQREFSCFPSEYLISVADRLTHRLSPLSNMSFTRNPPPPLPMSYYAPYTIPPPPLGPSSFQPADGFASQPFGASSSLPPSTPASVPHAHPPIPTLDPHSTASTLLQPAQSPETPIVHRRGLPEDDDDNDDNDDEVTRPTKRQKRGTKTGTKQYVIIFMLAAY